jgi:hypothetical protein
MPNKLLCVLTSVALTSLTCGSAFGSNNKAMDADIHSVELQWEHIKFDESASPISSLTSTRLPILPRGSSKFLTADQKKGCFRPRRRPELFLAHTDLQPEALPEV